MEQRTPSEAPRAETGSAARSRNTRLAWSSGGVRQTLSVSPPRQNLNIRIGNHARDKQQHRPPWSPPDEMGLSPAESADPGRYVAQLATGLYVWEATGTAELLMYLVQTSGIGGWLQELGLVPARITSLRDQLSLMGLTPETAFRKEPATSALVSEALDSSGDQPQNAAALLGKLLSHDESDCAVVLRHCGFGPHDLGAKLALPAARSQVRWVAYRPTEQSARDPAARQLYAQLTDGVHPSLYENHPIGTVLANLLVTRARSASKTRGVRHGIGLSNIRMWATKQTSEAPTVLVHTFLALGIRHLELMDAASEDRQARAELSASLAATQTGLIQAQVQYLLFAQVEAHTRLADVLTKIGGIRDGRHASFGGTGAEGLHRTLARGSTDAKSREPVRRRPAQAWEQAKCRARGRRSSTATSVASRAM